MIKKIVLCTICVCISFFAGAQCISGDCQNGNGTYTFPSGAKYSGSFKNGKLDGFGKLYFSGGDLYEGDWLAQYRHGKGQLQFHNGDRYKGDFYKSKMHGFGEMIYAGGKKYEGTWTNNKRHGRGSLTLANGDVLAGEFINDAFAGHVDQTIDSDLHLVETKNNRELPDELEQNIATDQNFVDCNDKYCHQITGLYTFEDGSKYLGRFKYGQPDGRGICFYKNGDKYEGDWQVNKPHGEGTFYFLDGRVTAGIWNYGRLTRVIHEDDNRIKPIAGMQQDPEVKIWAVVVGIARYNHMPSLKYTDDDAYQIYAFLKSPEGGALPDEQIKILIDEDAKRSKILTTMRDVFKQADENDVVFFYYSGHGINGHFIPSDFDGMRNVVEHNEVKEILDQTKAKNKICFIDACYSGSLLESKSLKTMMEKYYEILRSQNGSTAFLMSSKSEEVSLEDGGLRQGIFSHYLIRGLKGEADLNRNKIVTITELYRFVHDRVKSYTLNSQTPILAGQYNLDMPVAMVR